MYLTILFEDNHVLVVYKPKGVLSQADGSSSIDILNELKTYLKVKYNKPGEAYLGLVHRLDRNTSGVMVFAKTSKAAARLQASILNNEFIKKYYALVEGTPSGGRLIHNLYKNEREKKSYIRKDGKEAILNYIPIENKKMNGFMATLIDITLETGRFHQIRCQMAAIGHPLVGDKKYGSRQNVDYFLDCYSLSFPHPITKEVLTYTNKKETD